jgi:glyoxylase I family protein
MVVGGCATHPVRLEHVALNVPEPEAMAKWYAENLGMKIMREGPAPVSMRFITDAGENMMLELYHNPADEVPDYRSMGVRTLHIAFLVDDVAQIRGDLLDAGATMAEDVEVTDAGDEILILRDPWGIPIQFIKRAEPMLKPGRKMPFSD